MNFLSVIRQNFFNKEKNILLDNFKIKVLILIKE